MAHLKLFFPNLSNSNGVINMLFAHSALTTINYNSQDQNIDIEQEKNIKKTALKQTQAKWRRMRQSKLNNPEPLR